MKERKDKGGILGFGILERNRLKLLESNKPVHNRPEEDMALKIIQKNLLLALADEEDAIRMYGNYANIYGNFGWRNMFESMKTDEKKHYEMLMVMLNAVNDKIQERMKSK